VVRALEFIAFKTMKAVFFFLPRTLGLVLGKELGILSYHLDKKHRRLAMSNLRTALGGSLPPRVLKKLARASFAHFGLMTAEILKLPRLSDEKIGKLMRAEGEAHLVKALELGRGVLVFSAHLGNWEIASFALSRFGALNVVARPLDNPRLEDEINRLRNRLGAKVIYKQKAGREILQALRRNEIVAILIDQNVLRREAVFVDFFGLDAATTPGLAAFSLRTGSPIIPVFCLPGSRFSYRLKIGEPVRIGLSGDVAEDVLKITRHCTKMIENEIRQHPGSWLWFHNRWKTRPVNEAQESAAEQGAGMTDVNARTP